MALEQSSGGSPRVPRVSPRVAIEQEARKKNLQALQERSVRRLDSRYAGSEKAQSSRVQRVLQRRAQEADQRKYIIETINKNRALAQEKASIRREQAVLQRRAAILSKVGPLSIKEIMTAFPKLEPYELGKLEKRGVSFVSAPTVSAMEQYSGQYSPVDKEVRLTPWTDYGILEHEIGGHATQHLNPGQQFMNMPFATQLEQLPYSGPGSLFTPAAQVATGNYPEYGDRPQEKLAWTAQGEPYGGINTDTFFNFMYRPEYQTPYRDERQYSMPQFGKTQAHDYRGEFFKRLRNQFKSVR